ncbi:Uncharacterised protein [Arcanobacterium haemolyticum]|nr:Uncharacterised protein [Arcanobacterium haemolyticum]
MTIPSALAFSASSLAFFSAASVLALVSSTSFLRCSSCFALSSAFFCSSGVSSFLGSSFFGSSLALSSAFFSASATGFSAPSALSSLAGSPASALSPVFSSAFSTPAASPAPSVAFSTVSDVAASTVGVPSSAAHADIGAIISDAAATAPIAARFIGLFIRFSYCVKVRTIEFGSTIPPIPLLLAEKYIFANFIHRPSHTLKQRAHESITS